MNPIDLLYPQHCIMCGDICGDTRDGICPDCLRKIKLSKAHRLKGEYFTVCISPFAYEGTAIESLQRYKFGGKYSYAKGYAKNIKRALDEYDIQFELITWIPISALGKLRRKYDQSELIAKELSKLCGVKCRRTLVKVRNNKRQSTLASNQRKANVLGVYSVPRSSERLVRGKNILLIDDIVTTGSTMSEASRILLLAGALSITGSVVAMTALDKVSEKIGV